ncbi:phage virion morphogenesis protein, partial [Muribaculum intestinale]
MNDTDKAIRSIIRKIISDIKVWLGDEFDQNFERQAFFSQSWARRKSPTRPGGHMLVDTGALRRSVRGEIRESSIVFFSDLPYASIHNEGGEIKVTARMKRFFWYKYYSATGSFGRRKDGTLR